MPQNPSLSSRQLQSTPSLSFGETTINRQPRSTRATTTKSRLFSSPSSNTNKKDGPSEFTLLERLAVSVSQRAAVHGAGDTYKHVYTPAEARALQVYTFLRVSIPSLMTGIVATFAFPALSLWLCSRMNSAGVFTVLSTDSSQFVQNFLAVASLLFSILVGQTYCK